jgi:hypothetical protein
MAENREPLVTTVARKPGARAALTVGSRTPQEA